MRDERAWVFVDDLHEEAKIFAEALQSTGLVKVEVMTPAEARVAFLKDKREPAGVLMDVDLSSIAGEFGTGPGIAQDIRTKQKAGTACEFPIVRFSAAEPVARNVTGDPSSDDLFELKILKDDVRGRLETVASQLVGLREVYDYLISCAVNLDRGEENLLALFGVCPERFPSWVHEGLKAKILSGVTHAPHVAAGAYFRLFLIPAGLLIDQSILALRLGVDIAASGRAWEQLVSTLDPIKYVGAGGHFFERWWSRGVDDWWFSNIDKSGPLSGKTVDERVKLIADATRVAGLIPIASNALPADTRFWRFCKLGLENNPPDYFPVDPADSVRLTAQVDLPSWIEPFSASPKMAFRKKNDPRLNQKDLARLQKKYKA
jgi:CheY-like chemotaxis protein